MKLSRILKISMFLLIAWRSFSALLTEIVAGEAFVEGASQFTLRENAIYQQNIGSARARVFENHYSPKVVKIPGAYLAAMHAFAGERARIAELCVDEGLIDASEGQSFKKFRPAIDVNGIGFIKTPLPVSDSQALYKEIYQKFRRGSGDFGTTSAALVYTTIEEKKAQKKTQDAIMENARQRRMIDISHRPLLQDPTSSEIHCFDTLLATSDSRTLFRENPELGKIFRSEQKGNRTSNSHFVINPDVVMATLRLFVSLNRAENRVERIWVGSINCLALPIEGGYQYYKYFVLDHIRSPEHINSLLNYADQYWQEAIFWNRDDSKPFLESMARFYWAQTIAMPYARGSEANAKEQLTFVARYHGQELISPSNFAFRMPFVMSSEEFVDYFQVNVFLKSELSDLIG